MKPNIICSIVGLRYRYTQPTYSIILAFFEMRIWYKLLIYQKSAIATSFIKLVAAYQ